MSEESVQSKGLRSSSFGPYRYYSCGSSTIQQLVQIGVIPRREYGSPYKLLKPDALIVLWSATHLPIVVGVVEYKQPSEFNTVTKRQDAAKQCSTYCQILGAKFGIATDNQEFIWVNPQAPVTDAEITYRDRDVFSEALPDVVRGYGFILGPDGYPMTDRAALDEHTDPEAAQRTAAVVQAILSTITASCSRLTLDATVDPSSLARSIWQIVWIAKSATPEKALSTFVEVFIFKYLSDLGVLSRNAAGADVTFDYVLGRGPEDCLRYYASNVRDHIKALFPAGQDGTTVLNAMSLQFAVREDNAVFHEILKRFKDFGPLRNIDPQFKSRLFEDFLKLSISRKNWGQYFTPRTVVKAMVKMSHLDQLAEGAKVCDPACGVGGFVLEPMLAFSSPAEWTFVEGRLTSRHVYTGFEKGFDQDEKLTIVLAKANFLVYLSDLLAAHASETTEFANAFNSVFRVFDTTILGSLSDNRPSAYDLIMSNPPYVMSGSAQIKNAIAATTTLREFFKINGLGLEGLFLEKIVRELKPGGQAFVVLPDGLLNRLSDDRLRSFVLEECVLEAVVSLPVNTFYSTPKKTYILAITKKYEGQPHSQTEPVFSYLVKDIGETLDAQRRRIEANDLPDMVREYKRFLVDKTQYHPTDPKCKVWPSERFRSRTHWSIDRWWTREERIAIGMEEAVPLVSQDEFYAQLKDSASLVTRELRKKPTSTPTGGLSVDVALSNTQLFDLFIGNRVLRQQLIGSQGAIPVYSANARRPMGMLAASNIDDFVHDYLIWGIDGNWGFSAIHKNTAFATTDHCGAIRIKDPDINVEYLRYQLELLNKRGLFDRELRASLTSMRSVHVTIPVTPQGRFDRKAQRQLVKRYLFINNLKEEIAQRMEQITECDVDLTAST